ncbi:MAG: hypothetical protein ACYDDF_09140 [Thermoplasmatota archaeon]
MPATSAIVKSGLELEVLGLHAEGLGAESISWRIHAERGVFLKPKAVAAYLCKAKTDPRIERALALAQKRPSPAAEKIVATEEGILARMTTLERLIDVLQSKALTSPPSSPDFRHCVASLAAASRELRGWFDELREFRERLPPRTSTLDVEAAVEDLSKALCDGCRAKMAGLPAPKPIVGASP